MLRVCRQPLRTWRSEHLVEVKNKHDLENLVEVLHSQSNVELGYTAQPLHEAVDAAIDELLDR